MPISSGSIGRKDGSAAQKCDAILIKAARCIYCYPGSFCETAAAQPHQKKKPLK